MRFLSVLFLLCFFHALHAQTGQPYTDTVHKKPLFYHYKKSLYAAVYVCGTYAVYRYADQSIRNEVQEAKTAALTGIAKVVSPLGLGKYQTIGLGAVGLTSIITKNKKLQKTAIIWAGSLAVNSIVTNEFKITFQRHRPNSGDPYNVFDWKGGNKVNTSFISAHTSNIFTTATVFASLYKDTKWVPFAAYGLASLTALSRIYDDAHWTSDVLAGAFIGFMSAKGMIRLYNRGSKKILILPSCSSLSITCVF